MDIGCTCLVGYSFSTWDLPPTTDDFDEMALLIRELALVIVLLRPMVLKPKYELEAAVEYFVRCFLLPYIKYCSQLHILIGFIKK